MNVAGAAVIRKPFAEPDEKLETRSSAVFGAFPIAALKFSVMVESAAPVGMRNVSVVSLLVELYERDAAGDCKSSKLALYSIVVVIGEVGGILWRFLNTSGIAI